MSTNIVIIKPNMCPQPALIYLWTCTWINKISKFAVSLSHKAKLPTPINLKEGKLMLHIIQEACYISGCNLSMNKILILCVLCVFAVFIVLNSFVILSFKNS